ncbi:MAG: hypothetical protein ACTHU0_21455 [Kofleriaceae bacterium]
MNNKQAVDVEESPLAELEERARRHGFLIEAWRELAMALGALYAAGDDAESTLTGWTRVRLAEAAVKSHGSYLPMALDDLIATRMENAASAVGARDGVEQWAIVEILGHRRHIGTVATVDRFGTRGILVQDLQEDGSFREHFYAGAAIFAVTPTDERGARLAFLRHGERSPCGGFMDSPVLAGYCRSCGLTREEDEHRAREERRHARGDELRKVIAAHLNIRASDWREVEIDWRDAGDGEDAIVQVRAYDYPINDPAWAMLADKGVPLVPVDERAAPRGEHPATVTVGEEWEDTEAGERVRVLAATTMPTLGTPWSDAGPDWVVEIIDRDGSSEQATRAIYHSRWRKVTVELG